MKPAKILYFIDGFSPTPEDFEAASKLTAQVSFRNAQHVPAEGALEDCDGVAGCVPAPYEGKPTAEEAIKAVTEKLAALSKKVGDEPAPTLKKTAETAPKAQATTLKAAEGGAPAWTPNKPQA
jgi:hypothetical protein